MSDQPLVSIIIPTYNRAHLIGETLDSVVAQTYENWECIIVDDGSSDNTDEVVDEYVKKDSRFKYYHRPDEHLQGGNGARNYGFKMSQGQYVNWFDSDDLMLPEMLELKVKAMLEKHIDFVICSGKSSDSELNNIKNKIVSIDQDLYESYTLWESKIMLPSVLFERFYLLNKTLFNENLIRSQENEFFSRVFFQMDYDYSLIFNPLYIYRQHLDNKRSQQKTEYKPDFIYSFSFVSLNNLERGLQIHNTRIVNFHLKKLIDYFFLTYHNSDFINFNFIYVNLVLNKIESKKLLFVFLKFSYALHKINLPIPYRLEKLIKNSF
jgi:glycosyltransferase involved in cell wall biosynthesis